MTYLYRVVSLDDFEQYYELKSDPEAVLWSGFPDAPDRALLLDHFKIIIEDKNTFLYFLMKEGQAQAIGYTQFSLIGDGEAQWDGTSIKSDFHGNGYGNDLTQKFIAKLPELNVKRITGYVSEDNVRSIKMCEASGFHRTDQPTKLVRMEAFDSEQKFYFYEKLL